MILMSVLKIIAFLDHSLLATPAASVATTSLNTGPRRTQILKIGHVQNDVTVSSGFHVNTRRHISTTPVTEGVRIMPIQTMFFTEGYHRCAFLTLNCRESRNYIETQRRNGRVATLASELLSLENIDSLLGPRYHPISAHLSATRSTL